MTTVFIPTRAREHCLVKVLPKWGQQRYVERVILVVEKWEYGKHKALSNFYDNVDVMRLPNVDQGINFARRWIVKEADRLGLKRIIMSDDDLYPHPTSDVSRLFEFNGHNLLGMGIALPFYGLTFGNTTLKEEDRPLMSKGALGKRCFSLDVERVLEVGNFESQFHSGWGDDELVRQGMAQLQATWYVHAGVKGVSIAGRYTKGGLNDLHGEQQHRRERAQEASHKIIYERWPSFANKPGKKLVFQWKQFMDEYVPDWRERITWVKK